MSDAKRQSECRAQIEAEIRRLDPKLEESDDSFKAAAVMLAALRVGCNESKIAKVLGYPADLVSEFGFNLQKSGIWKDGKTHANWGDPKDGAVEFWVDVCVARGFLVRK